MVVTERKYIQHIPAAVTHNIYNETYTIKYYQYMPYMIYYTICKQLLDRDLQFTSFQHFLIMHPNLSNNNQKYSTHLEDIGGLLLIL